MSLADGSLGIVEQCDLTRMNVIYTGMANGLLSRHNGVAWTVEELANLRSEVSKSKNVIGKMFGTHCSSSLFTVH